MRRPGIGVLLSIALAALVLVAGVRVPDLEVRAQWRAYLGHTVRATPPGQVLRCERDGLRRIDLAVTPLMDGLAEARPEDFELVLRAGGPEGEVLQRVPGAAFEPFQWGGWLAFELEPVADSAGRDLHVALVPRAEKSGTRVWCRVRGIPSRDTPWTSETLGGPVILDTFVSEQPDLRAVAFEVAHLEGPLGLTVSEAATGNILRRNAFVPAAPVEEGWVAIDFEPLPESRWVEYELRVSMLEGDTLHGAEGRPRHLAFHGSGEVDARLGGMTLGVETFADRDLIFRAWTSDGPGVAFSVLRERLGGRLVPLVLAWLAASALLLVALPRPRG